MEKLIWQIYACVYDLILERFIPYRQMIDKTVAALNPGEGGVYLDAGCGTGNFLVDLSRRNKKVKVVGIDFSSAMLKRARNKSIQNNFEVDLKVVDLNSSLPFDHFQFDGIICSNVLYAVKNPSQLVNKLKFILKDHGLLVITTPRSEPKMLPVIREHLVQLKNKFGIWGTLVFTGQILYIFIPLMVLLILNSAIRSNQAYHFFNKNELRLMLEDEKFMIVEFCLVYGQQNWFVVAKKALPVE